METSNHWDRAVVLNRDDREDRMKAFSARAGSSTLLGKVQRFSALTSKTIAVPTWFAKHQGNVEAQACHWGCRESHLRIWSQAIADNVQHLLVFEDDAVIPIDFDERATTFIAELPEDWMGYQLGGFKWAGVKKVTENCGRMLGCGGMHAYGLSSRGLRRVYDHVMWHNRIHLDYATSNLHGSEPHFYAPKEWFVDQARGYSNLYMKEVKLNGLGVNW